MNKHRKWLWFIKHTKEITISKDLEFIEIYELWTVFGIVLKEESREVFVPRISIEDSSNLQVIAEAYKELRVSAMLLKQEEE